MKKPYYMIAMLSINIINIIQGAATSSTIIEKSSDSFWAIQNAFGTSPQIAVDQESVIPSYMLGDQEKFDEIRRKATLTLQRSTSLERSPSPIAPPEEQTLKLSLALATPFEKIDDEIKKRIENGADPNIFCAPTKGEQFPSVWFAADLATIVWCRERGFNLGLISSKENSFAHHLIKEWPYTPEKFAILRYTLNEIPHLINAQNESEDTVLTLFAKNVGNRIVCKRELATYRAFTPERTVLEYLIQAGADPQHKCFYTGGKHTAATILEDRAIKTLHDPNTSAYLSSFANLLKQ